MKVQNKKAGFTLIELLVVVAILGIVVFSFIQMNFSDNEVSWGFNGAVETRCVNGYVHSVGQRGFTQQTLDENGHGIKCGSK
jgi:prepilin-type N-terminal cleavage/methylation domain-containing protein